MRIIAFGCSYTYGQGLADCHVEPDHPGPKHSNYAWPSLLASNLNCQIVNVSQPGYSNCAILYEILKFDFQQDDIICVLWTYKNRDARFENSLNPIKLGHWNKKWFESQNSLDLLIKNKLHIHHAYCFLKSNQMKFYFMDVDVFVDLHKLVPLWYKKIDFIPIDIINLAKQLPLGLDNLHPGPYFHSKVADTFLQSIAG